MTLGAFVLAAILLAVVVGMLLRRQLREKYAAFWLIIGLAALLLAVFPQLLLWLTVTLGFQIPANLLFTLAIVLLLAVALHLSWELSRAEEEIRRLAEEAGIAALELKHLAQRVAALEEASTDREPDETDHGV